jgi:probable HAF family extracellular repeat protein
MLALVPLAAAAACAAPLPPQAGPAGPAAPAAPTVTATVLRTPDGRTTVPVPVGPDGTETRYYPPSPRSINDEGQIVGYSPTEIASTVVEPVLWQDGDQAVRLSSSNTAAVNVNDSGQVLIEPAAVPEGQPLRMPTLWHDGEQVELPAPYRRPIDLNERGEVLVTGSNSDAAIWADGRITAVLRPPPRIELLVAYDISDTGTVVGGVGDLVSPLFRTYEWRPFVWRNGRLTVLDLEGTAVAVNGPGQILVGSDAQPDGSRRMALWSDGVATDLGLDRRQIDGVDARTINDQGQVVGAKDGRAVLWDNGQVTDLGTPEGTTSAAVAVNERGQVVGTMETADGTHGFVWTSGHLLDLGPVHHSPVLDAHLDINERGQIIGRTGSPWSVDDATAVLWEVHDPAAG